MICHGRNQFSAYSQKANASVWRAYKGIARHIHQSGLQAGDRLPPQDELCRIVNASSGTLTRAMAQLAAVGVLTRKTRVGTLVADLAPLERLSWSVGVLSLCDFGEVPMPFFADLAQRVLARLSFGGCRCTSYFRTVAERREEFDSLDHFHGVMEDLDHDLLDGLVLLTNLDPAEWRATAARGVALCHIGIWQEAPCGAAIDWAGMADDALSRLAARGCRRIGVQADHLVATPVHPLTRGPVDILERLAPPGVADGRDLAERLLQRSPAQRPDGLILFDNYTTLGLTERLAAAGGYRPAIAAITSRHIPMTYALPVMSYELDSDALVERTVTLLRRRLIDPRSRESVAWVTPLEVREPVRSPPQAVAAANLDAVNV